MFSQTIVSRKEKKRKKKLEADENIDYICHKKYWQFSETTIEKPQNILKRLQKYECTKLILEAKQYHIV